MKWRMATNKMEDGNNIQRVHKLVKPETLAGDIKELCQIVYPSWKSEEITYEKLSGGLLNEIYKCSACGSLPKNSNEALIVRIYTLQDVCELVDRSKEIIGMQVGHAAGVSEPLHIIFDNGLVYGYAPGRTVNWGLLWDDHVARKYLGSLAKFHVTDPEKIIAVDQDGKPLSIEKPQSPGLFERMRNVIRDIPEEFEHFPDRALRMRTIWSKERFEDELDLLENHFSKFRCNMAFSHNDVWVNNMVYDMESDNFSILDFEYCDYNYEAFDVGSLFNCFRMFDAYREIFPDNIMKPTDEEMKLPRDENHRKKLVRFYLEEKYRFLGKEPTSFTQEEFTEFHTQTEMLAMVVHLFWSLFGFSQSDDPTVTWNIFEISERGFENYCQQRKRLFEFQPTLLR